MMATLLCGRVENVRQIAQEARISFRNIAAILKKKEAAVNDDGDGSRSGNEIAVVDNQPFRFIYMSPLFGFVRYFYYLLQCWPINRLTSNQVRGEYIICCIADFSSH
ncbi:MAG TPA: hypothetical protein VI278_13005 [Nitrososphaeraceae archaeon]|jgi:hypothetical protein